MATLVQTDEYVTHLLNELIELDREAVAAYEAAIDRMRDVDDKEKLRAFAADHGRHFRGLASLLDSMGAATRDSRPTPSVSDLDRSVDDDDLVGRPIDRMFGDDAILRALRRPIDENVAAFERAARRKDLPSNVRRVLDAIVADERRHRAWLEQRLDDDAVTLPGGR